VAPFRAGAAAAADGDGLAVPDDGCESGGLALAPTAESGPSPWLEPDSTGFQFDEASLLGVAPGLETLRCAAVGLSSLWPLR
jgi:hypothetical protein